MSEIITIKSDVSIDEIIHELSDLFVDDLVNFIVRLDNYYGDPELTQQLAEYFSNKVSKVT